MSFASDSEPAAGGECPDEASIAAFLEGRRSPELEAHLAGCDECRQLVSELAKSVRCDETLPSASGELTQGSVIADKYRIDKVLGAGGMGVVALAEHLVLNTSVVVKLLRTPDADDDSVRRFLREARAGAALDSEHVVRVLDAGIFEARPYLVLEHLRGRDLAAELSARGALPLEEAVNYVLQACEALATAHSRGIVHRDIKPANLFITRSADGEPLLKVLDFGIAKAAEDSGIATLDAGLTHSGTIMGSPRYMSPEQLEHSAGVDARTDVWSLGAVLYELCSGKAAFDAPNLAALTAAILTKEPPALTDVPPELFAVIGRCLRKKRQERLSSVALLARELAPFARADQSTLIERVERIAASSRSSVMPPAQAADVEGIRQDTPALASPSRRRFGWLLAAMVAIVAAVFFWSRPQPVPPLAGGGMARGALVVRALRVPRGAALPAASSVPSGVVAPMQSAVPDATARAAVSSPSGATPRVVKPPPSNAPSPSSGINASGLLDRK